ncbi:MAG: basic secretory family protein [Fuerstiella sp.]|nr:basic secretory family protein [Fuerstiella sp.]
MNTTLGKSFGFPSGQNVWRGKAVVVAFMQENSFHAFEQQVMGNPTSTGAQGICHTFPNGRVVVGCYRGESPSYFGVVLVHETAHGYIHRYRSTARIPSWINEGVADWVAAGPYRPLRQFGNDRGQRLSE